MDIYQALAYKREIQIAINTGDVDDPPLIQLALDTLIEYAEYYKDYLMDAAND